MYISCTFGLNKPIAEFTERASNTIMLQNLIRTTAGHRQLQVFQTL